MSEFYYGLSFDPGKATGIVYGRWNANTPFQSLGEWIVPGGPVGLSKWIRRFLQTGLPVDVVIAERFVPDGTAGGRETVSPQGEGVIIALFPETTIWWQLRADKTWGGSNIEWADAILQKLGLWKEGKDVEWTDGRDANDATLHFIAWLRKQKHRPTLRWITPPA